MIVEAASLQNQAYRYYSQHKYTEAEPLYKRALEIREKALGEDHPDVAQSLNNLAILDRARGRHAEAEAHYKRSLEIREKALGPHHPDVAQSLNSLAILYYMQGKYTEAEPLMKRSLEIRQTALGSDHPDVAQSLNSLAILYQTQGKYSIAEPLVKRALEIWEIALGPDHGDVAQGLNTLASIYLTQGKYAASEALYKRSLRIREKMLGPDHLYVAQGLNNLALLYRIQAKYAEAEPLFKRSLEIWQKALGPDHPNVATGLENLAILYRMQGKYTEAELLFKRSLEIRQKALGPDHRDVAQSLNGLVSLYGTQSKYAEGEALAKRSLQIWEKTLGPDHPNAALSLNNLADLYLLQGKYAEAEPLFKRSLEILQKALGQDHASVAQGLTNVASVFRMQGKYAEAEALYKRSLEIREKALGPQHPEVAETLNNLATLYEIQGRYADAEPLYKRSLEIREKALGPEHPDVALSLLSFASNLSNGSEDQHSTALGLVDRALQILDSTSAYPESRIDAYALRAKLRKENGNLDNAMADLAEALRSAEELRPKVGGGEETRAAFFEKYAEHFERMVTWQLQGGQIEKAFEYAERRRARVLLDQLAAGKIDLRSSIPPEIRAPLEKRESDAKAALAEYQQRITLMRSRKDLTDEERIKQINDLQERLGKAQRDYQQIYEEIKNASPLWRDLITSGGQPVSMATVQRDLVPRKGMLVLYQIGQEQSYVFVIPPVGQKPEVLPLKVTEEIAQALHIEAGPLKPSILQKILTGGSENLSSAGLQQLGKFPPRAHALWRLLVPENLWFKITRLSEIIIVPDGALHLLPFEALVVKNPAVDQDVRYWLDEGPAIIYAPSASSLYNIERRPDSSVMRLTTEPLVLSLSDPIYNPQKVALARQKESLGNPIASKPKPEDKSARAQPALSRTRDAYERAGGVLVELPGTARETDEIRKACEGDDGRGGAVLELRRLNADEPQLRASLPGKRYIHLATHGLCSEGLDTLFSALALTPPAAETSTTDNDGFLQLYEIYDLRLPQCELAVLSACQTNVGKNVKGEGVFGLSRGFLAAGARRVVASQWSVDDESTAKLMGDYFRRIIGEEKTGKRIDYALALRDAKRAIRCQKQWVEPYYWAPFILIGKQ
jgi:CHAT domain-containing protein/Tfp pilus assembly protein PilF